MKRCNTLVAFMKIFTARNSSYGKALFSEACVSHSVHRGGGGGRVPLVHVISSGGDRGYTPGHPTP